MSPRVRERLRAVADRLPPRVRRRLVRLVQTGAGRSAAGDGGGAADRPGRACPGHARRRTRAAGGHARDPAGRDGPAPASPGRRGSRRRTGEFAGQCRRSTTATVARPGHRTTGHARASWAAAAARTPWLLFLSPRQLLLPGAVETLMAARGADSTVVLGGLEGFAAPWSRTPLLGGSWSRTSGGRGPWTTANRTVRPPRSPCWSRGSPRPAAPTLRDDSSPRARLFERAREPDAGAVGAGLGRPLDADRPGEAMPTSEARARLVRWSVTYRASCSRSSAATRPSGTCCGRTPAELVDAAGRGRLVVHAGGGPGGGLARRRGPPGRADRVRRRASLRRWRLRDLHAGRGGAGQLDGAPERRACERTPAGREREPPACTGPADAP